jgi:hypothetical protein
MPKKKQCKRPSPAKHAHTPQPGDTVRLRSTGETGIVVYVHPDKVDVFSAGLRNLADVELVYDGQR